MKIRIAFFLFITYLPFTASAQTIITDSLLFSKGFITSKESILFTEARIPRTTYYASSHNYTLLYSEATFSFHLMGNESQQIIDNLTVDETLSGKGKLQDFKAMHTDAKDAYNYGLGHRLGFSSIAFVNDSIALGGVCMGNREVFAVFIKITKQEKLEFFTKPIQLFSNKEKRLSKKDRDRFYQKVKLTMKNMYCPDMGSITFSTFTDLERMTDKSNINDGFNYMKENQTNLFIYSYKFGDEMPGLLYSEPQGKKHAYSRYRDIFSAQHIVHLNNETNVIKLYNSNYDILFEKSFDEELREYFGPRHVKGKYLVKNSFTNQVYLVASKALSPKEDYDYFIFELSFSPSENRMDLSLVKKLYTNRRISINCVMDNNLQCIAYRNKKGNIYVMPINNEPVDHYNLFDNCVSDTDVNILTNRISDYCIPDRRLLHGEFGEIEEDQKTYPSGTIEDLISSYITSLENKRWGYRIINLSVYDPTQIELINKQIRDGEFLRDLPNELMRLDTNSNVIIETQREMIGRLGTENHVIVSDTYEKIILSNSEEQIIYQDFIKAENKWRYGNLHKRKKY